MERIGRYEIAEEIGRGAMGIVFRAHDPRMEREVALKTVKLGDRVAPEETEDLRERLVQEAKAAGRLNHPGIVTVFDQGCDEDEEIDFIAMELVEGQKLSDTPVDEFESGPKMALLNDLLGMAGAALDYAHARGIVHRDIKPANIMITGAGIKIMDFGVARVASSQLTTPGSVIGTPNYMSPEQVNDGAVDGRSDQFSLAVIVYEILTGSKPFDGGNMASTLYKVVHQEPVPVQQFTADISPGIEAVVMRALSKAPEDRYESCGAFAQAFAAASGAAGRDAVKGLAPDRGDAERSGDETVIAVPAPVGDPGGTQVPALGSPPLPLPSAAVGLPLSEASREIPPPPALGQPVSRWPKVVFALLLCAVGALAFTLTRYPGMLQDLLRDPSGFAAMLFGSAPEAPAQEASTGLQPAQDEPQPDPLPEGPPEKSDTVARVATIAPEPVPADPPPEPPAELDPARESQPEPEPAKEPEPVPPPPRTAEVVFTSPVRGVRVQVDGRDDWSCVTPCEPIPLTLGEHAVVASRAGFEVRRRTIKVGAEGLSVDFPLAPVQATLVIASVPSRARIFVNGRDTGRVTADRVYVSPGRHTVRVVKGAMAATKVVRAESDKIHHVEFRLAPP